MTTILTPEISKRKQFYISRHRYYELKHFCLQYPDWQKLIHSNDILKGNSLIKLDGEQVEFKDPVHDYVASVDSVKKCAEMVEAAAYASDPSIANYILQAVCYGKTYEELRELQKMPCGRSYFYKAYRKFFWYLDKLRK